MKKGHYYAVLASNGAFVHPCYDRAVYCRDRYFRPPCIIKKIPQRNRGVDSSAGTSMGGHSVTL